MEFASSEVQTLVDLGLTVSQARVYLALIRAGPSKISAISEISKVARPDIYRTLAKLHDLGLVEQIIKTPLHFEATPLEKSLVSLLDIKTSELRKLRSQTKQLLHALEVKGKPKFLHSEDNQFVLIPPRKAIIARIRASIEGAQRTIDHVISWRRFSFGLTSAFTESVKRALARDVKFRFIMEAPPNRNISENVLKFWRVRPSFQIRFISNRPKTILSIIDAKQLFIIVDPTANLPDSPALWSNNQSLLSIAQEYFNHLWNATPENPNYKVDSRQSKQEL